MSAKVRGGKLTSQDHEDSSHPQNVADQGQELIDGEEYPGCDQACDDRPGQDAPQPHKPGPEKRQVERQHRIDQPT